ncbi:MAG: radical SAM protein [Paenibacillaceae bacterium]
MFQEPIPIRIKRLWFRVQRKWKVSRFSRNVGLEGQVGRVLYNSFTGAIAAINHEEAIELGVLLEKGEVRGELTGLASALGDIGFLVPEHTDELLEAQKLHESMKDNTFMHLIVMPTEACNFRCTYCYQSFPHGSMSEETIQGLKNAVRDLTERISHLSLSWFGGEPLLAPEIIADLSASFIESCHAHNVEYVADMSTNGYHLTKERFQEMLRWQVRRFMITLDGIGESHDRRRKLIGGQHTYERIVGNLLAIRDVEGSFEIDIRVNFDKQNLMDVPELLKELSALFKGDPRFQILIRPVGRWGGPEDDHILVCDRTAADVHLWELTNYGIDQGIPLSVTIGDSLQPSGSVCYAAKPGSLVVSSSGSLHKCSIALDEEINKVGQLHSDGSMDLDVEKISVWTGSGEEMDTVCQSCYYRPACQGNHCPLYRMRTGKRPCPHEKRKIKQVLNLLWKDANITKGTR